jgi:hypothetical protein
VTKDPEIMEYILGHPDSEINYKNLIIENKEAKSQGI